MRRRSKIYFDTQDYELLGMVNRLLSSKNEAKLDTRLFDANLHPHGIKSLTASREMRIAVSVVRLLDSLEAGRAEDRLQALGALYDEVLTTAQSTLRRNTARVLIQTMKELVRSQGSQRRQLTLAHDFLQAVSGKPRIVRRLLYNYHLIEMPEEWSQLAFDHHVHDANTKGRKNPTHLIMDAWLKGIRYLTVIYYNYVEADAAYELLRAADIMGMSVRIGLEFASPFRGRYVHFIWAPRGFTDAKGFLEFLAEAPMRRLMEKGRAASAWQEKHIYALLDCWNEQHRLVAEKALETEFPPLSAKDFRTFVGTGQASKLHLAEFIYKNYSPPLLQRIHELQRERQALKPEARASSDDMLRKLREMTELSHILDAWLSPEANPGLPDPDLPGNDPDLPEILRLSPLLLLDRLSGMRSGHRITLNLAGLGPEDVLELLWICQGLITHLEIFNVKDWLEGKLSRLKEISLLQLAANTGSAPRLKHLIRDMIKGLECEPEMIIRDERCALFREILRNIPTLQGFYKTAPLRARIGTDSTSRARKTLGMGLVFDETLPLHVQRRIAKHRAGALRLPLAVDLFEQIQYRRSGTLEKDSLLSRAVRRIPGLRHFGFDRRQVWHSQSASTTYVEKTGNIITMGGSIASGDISLPPPSAKNEKETVPPRYLNTKLSNVLKVLAGLIPAFLSFQYTQDGWLLAWGGAFVWFGITGLRNIVQSVVGGGGIFRSTLLRWNDYISWTRLCDSLMYTGFSVPLLELGVRSLLLEQTLGLTVVNTPVAVYTVIAVINGAYICSHNLYRGLPKEAAVANIFRSVLAVPVSVLYNIVIYESMVILHVADPYLLIQPAATVISKLASDTVAALIEGSADRRTSMRMRHWDYKTKLAQIFDTYAQLELLFPEADVLAMLGKPMDLLRTLAAEAPGMEIRIIINALDLMHFRLYLPRARDSLMYLTRTMSEEERNILYRSQLILMCEQEVSRLFVEGIAGRNFGRALAFYLDRHREYLKDMTRLCHNAHQR